MMKGLVIAHIVVISAEIMTLLTALIMIFIIKRSGIKEAEPEKYVKSINFWLNVIITVIGLSSINSIITSICVLAIL